MAKPTQKERLLADLQKGLSITPLDALKWYGSFRLSGLIFQLKAEGWDIRTEIVTQNRKHFAKYSLNNAKQQANQ